MKLWFSIYDEKRYQGDEVAFYNPSDYDWAEIVLKNKDIIINEFKQTINSQKLFDPYFNYLFSTTDGGWKTIGLKFWSINNYKNQQYFPEITKIINNIPGLISASFSKLEANSEIIPHNGDSNGFYRCHLGLDIPGKLPNCGFEVKGEQKSWGNGELLIFCDALYHRAWNNTENERYIMIFDIVRKEFEPQQNKLITTVLASMLLQKVGLKLGVGLNESFKRRRLKPLVLILRPFAQLAIWFTNYFKVY
ncbi:MAG: aspartyl/asparaginyl beta-hydroxylase domain-containing protein [Flavobacteriales bacterium]|nr:aspartyl/asparaginyl beta-hydroxylase domain-containing protein [Flavobacteriales bacterium]MCB9174741.1 aspartyl/asparaginyl beta-hydroxylase domain-containing protein [Flavobacteriales bacterium]